MRGFTLLVQFILSMLLLIATVTFEKLTIEHHSDNSKIGIVKERADCFYVIPNSNSPCPPSTECHTLAYYTANHDYFHSNTEFLFLPGVHIAYQNLAVRDVSEISLKGTDEEQSTIECIKNNVEFVFTTTSHLTVQNLRFQKCSLYSTLQIINGLDLLLQYVTIVDSGGIIVDNTFGNVSIHKLEIESKLYESIAHHHKQSVGGSSIKMDVCNIESNSSLTISDSHFAFSNQILTRLSKNSSISLSGMILDCNCSNVKVNIVSCFFTGFQGVHNGGNMALNLLHNLCYSLSVSLIDCVFEKGDAKHGGGIYITTKTALDCPDKTQTGTNDSILHLHNTTFRTNSAAYGGGAVYLKLAESPLSSTRQFQINMSYCVFCDNFLKEPRFGGIALHIINYIAYGYLFYTNAQVKITLANCDFNKNSIKHHKHCSAGNAVILVSRAPFLMIMESRLLLNKCTAILAIGSNLLVGGRVDISHNIGSSGGGFMFCEESLIFLSANTNLTIAHNKAQHAGGGICVEEKCLQSNPLCFFQLDNATAHNRSLQETINVNLIDNKARYAGYNLFGGTVEHCYMIDSLNSSLKLFKELFNIQPDPYDDSSNNTSVTSTPLRVCFCNQNKKKCSQRNKSVSKFPGESFYISAAIVGQLNGSVPGSVTAVGESHSLDHSEILQKITRPNCDTLKYTVRSSKKCETFKLRVQHDGDVSGYERYQTDYENIVVHVYLKECPVGFSLYRKTEKNKSHEPIYCRCARQLQMANGQIKCNISSQSILKKTRGWIGYISDPSDSSNEEKQLVYYDMCPFDLCNKNIELKSFNNSIVQDDQCLYNHTGILCGKCSSGLSVIMGGSQCWKCNNSSLSMLLLFAVAGIGLVVLLTFLNLTVSEGTLGGLLFYANAIQTIQPEFSINGTQNSYLQFLKVFISWINLDFGISACLYDGMDAYAKAWLQFVFPLYIWTLSGLIVYLCHRYIFVTKLVGTNSVKVLATLILLAYTKMLRAIITTMSFLILHFQDVRETESFGSTSNWSRKENFSLVLWLNDPNIVYLQGKHIPLFLVGVVFLILCLPFTFVLICNQQLHHIPRRTGLCCMLKLKPFLDTFTGQNSKNGRFWTGLLLLVRVIFCLLAAGWIRFIPLLYAVAAVVLLFLSQTIKPGVYSSHKLNMLENFHLLNLGCFCVLTAYLLDDGNHWQDYVTGISVTFAFIVFTSLLSTQVWRKIAKLQCILRLKARLLTSFTNVHLLRQPVRDDENVQRVNYPPFVNFDEDREPLLANSE